MDGCQALVLKRSIEYGSVDALRRCRSLYQKIGFLLDKWEDMVGDMYPRGRAWQELSCTEKCLDETEKAIWKLLTRRMTADAVTVGPGQSNENTNHSGAQQPSNAQLGCVQREFRAAHHSPSTNNQVVHVQRRVQVQNVAVQHVDAPQPKLLPISNNQQVINLLVDWYITLSENGIHLEGMLLNEGHWKTSPISVRVGPTTVKTASGTTYNISGKMFLPEEESIPDFVVHKFQHGFPCDWQEIVKEWTGLVERRAEVQKNVGTMPKKDPEPADGTMKPQGREPNSKVYDRDVDNDHNKMPPPNRAAHLQKRGQADKVHFTNGGSRSVSPKGRRSSNRVLMKSLTELSMNSSAISQSQDLSVDVNSLKRWSAEYVPETGELVLLGHLVSDSQHILDRNFVSSSVIRRLQADLIETSDGEVYRLLGPSNSSEMRLFIHGFPLRWKDNLKKGLFPQRTAPAKYNATRRHNAFTEKTTNPSQNIAKTNSRSSNAAENKSSDMSSTQQQRRTSQVIQQIVRHNIKQGQNSTVSSKSNHSLMGKKNDSLCKRKNRSVLPSQCVVPMKKLRPDDIKSQGGTFRRQQNDSEADVSSQSEQKVKLSRVKDSSAGKDNKAEREKSNMQTSQQGKSDAIRKQSVTTQLNTTGKYLSGKTSDVGCREFNFNMF